MSEKWQTVLVTMLGTFITALIASGKVPSEMAKIGWYDALYSPVAQSVLMGLSVLGYQAKVAQRFMGRVP